MTRPDLTIILSRSAQAGARKYVVSSRLLLVSGLLVLIMLTSFGLSGLHYYYMWKKTGDFSDLKGEVDRVRRENASLRVASEQLSEKVSLLEVTATKLKFLSGADEDAREGVGGPSKSLSPLYSLNHRELLKRFKSLDRRRFTLSTELRRLHDILHHSKSASGSHARHHASSRLSFGSVWLPLGSVQWKERFASRNRHRRSLRQ